MPDDLRRVIGEAKSDSASLKLAEVEERWWNLRRDSNFYRSTILREKLSLSVIKSGGGWKLPHINLLIWVLESV